MHARARDSLSGLRQGWRRERSVRTHVSLSVLACLLLLWAQPSAPLVLAVLMLLVLGLALELMNGALETGLDKLHPMRDPEVGAAKDMASAAAFVVNVAAAAAFAAAMLL